MISGLNSCFFTHLVSFVLVEPQYTLAIILYLGSSSYAPFNVSKIKKENGIASLFGNRLLVRVHTAILNIFY